MLKKYVILIILLWTGSIHAFAQCTWSTLNYDSFEYSQAVVGVIPSAVYGDQTPQIYAVHDGNSGMYLNFVDGYTGIAFDRQYAVCSGASYRFSLWTRDAFVSNNDMTFRVVDASNVVLSTITVQTGSTWVNVILPVFTATSSTIRFQIFTNIPGGGGNDAGVDELKLEECALQAGSDNAASYCSSGQVIDLSTFLTPGSQAGGNWTQTSVPATGTLNTVNGQWNSQNVQPGTYTFNYSLSSGGDCGSANFTVHFANPSNPDLGNDTSICSGETLVLNPGTFDEYLWSNNTSANTLIVSSSGTYWVRVGKLGLNQILNGDFETGSPNFTSQYNQGTGGVSGPLTNAGTYTIVASPSDARNNFVVCQDHTPAPGNKQLVVNGTVGGNTTVWCQRVPVEPGTDYRFEAWISSAQSNPGVAQLQFAVNNTSLGAVFSPSPAACTWSSSYQVWNAGASTLADICIVNQNTTVSANDFCIDDITFRPVCYSSDTVVVTVNPLPVVDLGPDQNHCEGTNVILDAQNPGSIYLWTSQETSQTISPDSSGNYGVTVTNNFGCSESDTISLFFEIQKNAGADSAGVLCSTTSQFELSDLLAVNATAGGIWNAGNQPGSVTSPNGTASFSGAGVYNFYYFLQGTYCPNDSSGMTITVNSQPVAASNQSLHYCNSQGETVNLTGFTNHPSQPNSPFWYTPDFPASNFNTAGNILDLSGVPHANYTIFHILPADSMCVQDTMKISLKVTAMPLVSFEADTLEGCQPLNVVFTDNSSVFGDVVYSWDLGNGQTSSLTDQVTGFYPNAACYDVTLTVTADNLCTSSLNEPSMICSWPLPVAAFSFSPQQIYSDGPVVTFDNTSTGYVGSAWEFGDGFNSSESDPEHTYPLGIVANYRASLTVTSEHGCTDEANSVIIIKDLVLFFVPNSFTPDGDEFNNTFLPVIGSGVDINDYSLEIFNRWGQIIFESHDPAFGWDGVYDGELVKEGTYIWKLYFGNLEDDSRAMHCGHVTLIR